MKRRAWIVLSAVTGIAAAVYFAGAQAAEKEGEKKGGLPPLVVDKDAPLLLDEPAEKPPADGPAADNTACFCCHTNYEEESFAAAHAAEDVGCIECHGKSHAHRDDEDNVTPPEVMYPPDKIAANCAKCHEEHNAPAHEVIVRWQQRCPAKTDPKQLVCTDCHGEHRLKIRTVRWDKHTGKLLMRKQDQTSETATKN